MELYINYGKRFLDIVVGFLTLTLLSPLLVVISIMQLFFYGYKVFYLQKRNTIGEKEFRIVKFKTMNDKKDIKGNLLPDADRLTSFGRFLRKTSLDELPNLINVVTGTMSLVGPRPLPTIFLNRMTTRQKLRYRVKSGLTGLAQVEGRNDLTWAQKFDLDIKYINQLSFWLDIQILLKTLAIFAKESINKDLNMKGIDNYFPDLGS